MTRLNQLISSKGLECATLFFFLILVFTFPHTLVQSSNIVVGSEKSLISSFQHENIEINEACTQNAFRVSDQTGAEFILIKT